MILDTIKYQDRLKRFLPAPRSSLNTPGPRGKAKSLGFNTRNCSEKSREKIRQFLIDFFFGPYRGEFVLLSTSLSYGQKERTGDRAGGRMDTTATVAGGRATRPGTYAGHGVTGAVLVLAGVECCYLP